MPSMRPIAAGRAPELLQLDAAARPGPPTDFLYNDWYPALRTDTLREPRLATLLNIPILLGRKRDNSLFALRDMCPHRGIPLSAGWFDGETVQCKYHGWRFEPCSGRCEEIPSLTPHDTLQPTKIYANAFPVVERDGYAWVYIPEPGAGRIADDAQLPPIPELPKFTKRFRTAHLFADLPCNVDHGIIGLMDPAHGPFVHQAWWWRSRHSIHEKQKQFEPIPNGFRMSAHKPSSNSAPYKLLKFYGDADSISTTIDFVLPNLRRETIRAGKYWFSSLTTVTPVTRDRSRIDVVACWNIFRAIPLSSGLLKFVFAKFVEQDRRNIELQSQGFRHNPHLMLIDDA